MAEKDSTPIYTRSSVINVFPDELRNARVWLAFNENKIPMDPKNHNMLAHWKDIELLTMEEALHQQDLFFYKYIGIIMKDPIFNEKGQLLCCGDIDFKNPEVQPPEWIPRPDNIDGLRDFVIRASTYAELTVSEKGYHIWFWLDAGGVAPTKNIPDTEGVGIFFHDHAIVMTGKILNYASGTINTIEPSFFGELLKATGYDMNNQKAGTGKKFSMPEQVKPGQINNYLTSFIGSCICQRQPIELVLTSIKAQIEEGILPYHPKSYVDDVVGIYNRIAYKDAKKERNSPNSPKENYSAVVARVTDRIELKDKEGKVTGDKLVLNRQKFVLYIVDKYSTISFGGLWIYKDGIYYQENGEILTELTNVMRELNDQSQIGHYREIESMLLGTNHYTVSPFNRAVGFIPVKNGIVELDYENKAVVGLQEFTPDLKFTYRLNAEYNSSANATLVTNVLKEWVDPEYVDVLLEIPAIGIVQSQINAMFKKSCLCQGETNSGKSSFIHLMHLFFGDDNNTISGVSIQKMTKNTFGLSRMENKIINMYDDLDNTELENYSAFKEITGIVTHDIEEKHKPSRKGRIFCYNLFTCNTPPSLPDVARNDAAFFGRWEYVSFPNEFAVDPTWYDRTFTTEFLSALLNLVIEKIISIYTTGKITSISDRDWVMSQWLMDSDPLSQFIDENTKEDKKGEYVYGKEPMYRIYCEWCSTNKIEPRKKINSVKDFSMKIQKFGFMPTQRRIKFGDSGKSVSCHVFISTRYWLGGMLQVAPEKPELLDV